MRITKHDGAVLLYNFAVVLSGAYLAWGLGVSTRRSLVGAAFVVALLWTVYFKFRMVARFSDHPRVETADEDGPFRSE